MKKKVEFKMYYFDRNNNLIEGSIWNGSVEEVQVLIKIFFLKSKQVSHALYYSNSSSECIGTTIHSDKIKTETYNTCLEFIKNYDKKKMFVIPDEMVRPLMGLK